MVIDFLAIAEQRPSLLYEMVLSPKVKPDIADDAGITLLMIYASFNSPEVVQTLLTKGANPNARDNKGHTALHYLSYYSILEDWRQEGDAPGPGSSEEPIRSALSILSQIAEAGGDLNMADEDGTTLLMRFSLVQSLRPVQLLLRLGTDVHRRDNKGMTALHYSVLELQDDYRNSEFYTSSSWCLVTKTLLDNGADTEAVQDFGATPLILAVQEGMGERVKLLVKYGARTETNIHYPELVVLLASLGGASPQLSELLRRAGPELVNMQVQESGRNAFSFAAERGDLDTCRMLLDVGADKNVGDAAGWTPLIYAAACGHEPVVHLLLDSGADVRCCGGGEPKSRWSGNALYWAIQRKQSGCARLLVEKGVSPLQSEGGPRSVNAAYAQCSEVLWAKRRLGETDDMPTLSHAVIAGDSTLVATMLEEFALSSTGAQHPSMQNGDALEAACSWNHFSIARMLLEAGADINGRRSVGSTALMDAASRGNLEAVQFLLDAGADTTLKGGQGETPADKAEEHSYLEVAHLIRNSA